MALHYLLDTNICIYIAKKSPAAVLNRFEKLSIGEVGMSTITYGELIFGAQKSQHPKKTLSLLEELASLIPPLPLSTETGKFYGKIREMLEKKGNIIVNNDLWIAAHALSLNTTLVTNNMKEFSRIPHLKLDNWIS
jgi:tRNA(fMet)-specific endonuclease VapC